MVKYNTYVKGEIATSEVNRGGGLSLVVAGSFSWFYCYNFTSISLLIDCFACRAYIVKFHYKSMKYAWWNHLTINFMYSFMGKT